MAAAQHGFIYLASQSPRRRQLLQQIGVEHRLLVADDDEDAEALEAVQPGELPADYVPRVTRLKLRAARRRLHARGWPDAPILCADTTVALGRRILGKPADAAEATAMLRALSGRSHRVLTAVALSHGQRRPAAHAGLAGALRGAAAAGDRCLRGQRRAFRQGRRVCRAGCHRRLDRACRRVSLRYHGFAPLRDNRAAAKSPRQDACLTLPLATHPKKNEVANQDILINWAPQETRVAVVENGAVQELHIERALERGLVGNVYLGKVARVLPGMQSAFIDIGLDRAAFLHVADLNAFGAGGGGGGHNGGNGGSTGNGAQAPLPIERQLFEGQTLTVQVIKDPIGSKGARLSAQVSIAGRMLVFLPHDRHIGVSQKIGSAELREQLRARLQALAGEGGGGFILRTNAEEASDGELGDDIAYLRKTWAGIRDGAHTRPAPTLLHQDLSLAERVLRDLSHDATQAIRIDSVMQYDKLRSFGDTFMPRTAAKLELYRGERPIFDLFNIEEEIVRALARRVDLKSGGTLVIDQTEAMTTVDVNTGGFVGARNFEDTVFKTNLEAAGAIARQLRLRNLGGMIIVDFIDMAREEHQAAVLSEFRKQLARDRTRVTVSGFSQLGLVEMTRKRTRESLAHMLCEPCPTCAGRGQVKTARSVCYDILREILREARQFNPREFRIVASAAVVETLLDEESVHLAGLSEFIGKPISLSTEPSLNPEQYDIVLM